MTGKAKAWNGVRTAETSAMPDCRLSTTVLMVLMVVSLLVFFPFLVWLWVVNA